MTPEHSLQIRIPRHLRDGGSDEERQAIVQLGEKLQDALERRAAGELDGEEFTESECVFYLYGPDADALFAAVEPVVRECELCRGGSVLKRYGCGADPQTREVRHAL